MAWHLPIGLLKVLWIIDNSKCYRSVLVLIMEIDENVFFISKKNIPFRGDCITVTSPHLYYALEISRVFHHFVTFMYAFTDDFYFTKWRWPMASTSPLSRKGCAFSPQVIWWSCASKECHEKLCEVHFRVVPHIWFIYWFTIHILCIVKWISLVLRYCVFLSEFYKSWDIMI